MRRAFTMRDGDVDASTALLPHDSAHSNGDSPRSHNSV